MDAAEVAERIGRGRQRRAGAGWSVPCPAHEDSSPSLTVNDGREGGVVLHCHAGCSFAEVLAAAGIDPKELGSQFQRGSEAGSDIIDVYRYTDEEGTHLFDVVRFAGKRFRQRRPDASRESGWNWSLGDVRRPLYRLPEILEAVRSGATVFVAEGEKDVEAIRSRGAVATCNPGGAGKWTSEHTRALRDADVIIVADQDLPGQHHARSVAKALDKVAQRVRIVESRAGKDAYDHFAAGYELEDFVQLTADGEELLLAPDIYEFLAQEDSFDWIVEGLLERGDRLMLTGFEGWGKSTLVRQLAVCCAAGIHPLKFSKMPPLRVLMIDCENGERQSRRHLRPLLEQANRSGTKIPSKALFPLVRPSGLDLTTEDDRNWLIERSVAHRPDIVFIGPLYNLHRAPPNEELPARKVAGALNDLRVKAKCCLVIEAHAGHGEPGKMRGVRPIGSSLWLRWSEFGYGLAPIKGVTTAQRTPLEFKAWRGPREERDWPDSVEHSNPWPWSGCWEGGGKFIGRVPA